MRVHFAHKRLLKELRKNNVRRKAQNIVKDIICSSYKRRQTGMLDSRYNVLIEILGGGCSIVDELSTVGQMLQK